MMQKTHETLVVEIETLGKQLEKLEPGPERDGLERRLERLEARRDALTRKLEEPEEPEE